MIIISLRVIKLLKDEKEKIQDVIKKEKNCIEYLEKEKKKTKSERYKSLVDQKIVCLRKRIITYEITIVEIENAIETLESKFSKSLYFINYK